MITFDPGLVRSELRVPLTRAELARNVYTLHFHHNVGIHRIAEQGNLSLSEVSKLLKEHYKVVNGN